MNRVSAFGNLEKAGAKRIATREKTIARKIMNYKSYDDILMVKEFVDYTNRMKDQ